jgi:hypothetical protein
MVDTQLSQVVFCMVLTFVVMLLTYLKSANYHSSLGANCYKGDCCGTKLIQCSVLGVAFLHFEGLGKHQDTNLDTPGLYVVYFNLSTSDARST